jgi:hypothetical protein
MIIKSHTYGFDKAYSKGTEPSKAQGCASLLSKSVRMALDEKKELLNSDELIEMMAKIDPAQDAPHNLSELVAGMYDVYTNWV